jgi:hypothetical protein
VRRLTFSAEAGEVPIAIRMKRFATNIFARCETPELWVNRWATGHAKRPFLRKIRGESLGLQGHGESEALAGSIFVFKSITEPEGDLEDAALIALTCLALLGRLRDS